MVSAVKLEIINPGNTSVPLNMSIHIQYIQYLIHTYCISCTQHLFTLSVWTHIYIILSSDLCFDLEFIK